jgi:hypothetical protein
MRAEGLVIFIVGVAALFLSGLISSAINNFLPVLIVLIAALIAAVLIGRKR